MEDIECDDYEALEATDDNDKSSAMMDLSQGHNLDTSIRRHEYNQSSKQEECT